MPQACDGLDRQVVVMASTPSASRAARKASAAAQTGSNASAEGARWP